MEYSQSKRVTINPDIVEFDEKGPEPLFDLIIGTETMSSLGIILDFQTKMIMIDDVKLPMRHIKSLQKEQKRCEISVSNADPNIVYVLASGIVGPDEGLYGIYKSIDAGESFTFECCNGSPVGTPTVSNPNTLGWSNDGTGDGGQIYYDLSMGASPTNSNKLFTK